MTRKRFLKYALVLISPLVAVLLYWSVSLAGEAKVPDKDIVLKPRNSLTIRASIGYRIDDLDWNVAGLNDFDQYMAKLSELVYKDMKIRQRGIAANFVIDRIYARSSISFGQIRDGEGTDLDYFYDEDRGGIFSPYSISKHEIYNDDVFDVTAGVGYQFTFLDKRMTIVPLAGISSHKQNIRMTDGRQTYTADQALLIGFPDVGPFSEVLDSTYKTKWTSWWLGTDINLKILSDLFLTSSLEYHIADYEAKADWNLIDHFAHPVSFIQEADGQGFVINIGIDYTFIPKWNVGIMCSWATWSTDRGIDRIFWAPWYAALIGSESEEGRLNEANWTSRSLNLSLSYKF
jgi:hypothetical protein